MYENKQAEDVGLQKLYDKVILLALFSKYAKAANNKKASLAAGHFQLKFAR